MAEARSATTVAFVIGALSLVTLQGCADVGEARGERDELRVHDRAAFLTAVSAARIEERLALWHREAGVDAHLLIERAAGNAAIEPVALQRFRELGVGRSSPGAQGLLLLVDPAERRLRIELGYGLEDIFPDAFLGWLLDDHAAHLFASDERELSLRMTLRILEHRVRRARLAGRCARDDESTQFSHEAGGAGASGTGVDDAVTIRWRGPAVSRAFASSAEARRSAATPEAAYSAYRRWLTDPRFDLHSGPFGAASRKQLAVFPITPAYKDWALEQERDRVPAFLVRGREAIVYSNNEPLVAPLFMHRTQSGWQIDLERTARLVAPMVGGPFTWTLRNHESLAPFADEIVRVDGYLRLRGGDNRPLPHRERRGVSLAVRW